MNKGSAWIPDGVLPPRSHPDYMKIYDRERRKVDKDYVERRKVLVNEAMKRYWKRKGR